MNFNQQQQIRGVRPKQKLFQNNFFKNDIDGIQKNRNQFQANIKTSEKNIVNTNNNNQNNIEIQNQSKNIPEKQITQNQKPKKPQHFLLAEQGLQLIGQNKPKEGVKLFNQSLKENVLQCKIQKNMDETLKFYQQVIRQLCLGSTKYLKEKQYNNALYLMMFAEKVSKQELYVDKDHNLRIMILNNMGSIYRHLLNYKNALVFHTQAVQYMQKHQVNEQIGLTYLNIVKVFQEMNDHEKAYLTCIKSVKECKNQFEITLNKYTQKELQQDINKQGLINTHLKYVGQSYLNLGIEEVIQNKNYRMALEHIKEGYSYIINNKQDKQDKTLENLLVQMQNNFSRTAVKLYYSLKDNEVEQKKLLKENSLIYLQYKKPLQLKKTLNKQKVMVPLILDKENLPNIQNQQQNNNLGTDNVQSEQQNLLKTYELKKNKQQLIKQQNDYKIIFYDRQILFIQKE